MVRSERTTRRFYEGCGKVHAPVSMLFPPIDPNERFRERRAAIRRRKRLRRSAAVGAFLVALALLGVGARFVGTDDGDTIRRRPGDAGGHAERRAEDASDRASRRPRDDGSRLASGEARRVPRSRARRPHCGRARRQGRERRDRVRAVVGSARRVVGRGARLLRRSRRGAARARARRLPHRPHRDVRGPGSRTRTPGSRDPPVRRLCVARCGRSRLDESLRPARVEVQRRRRDRGRASRLRRDHVRLRALPLRRRRRQRALPQEGLACEARGDPGVPSLRATPARPARRAGLGGRLRAVRRRAISGSASCRGAWRRTSTRCTR